MEFPSVTVILCIFAILIVFNYIFMDENHAKNNKKKIITSSMITSVREVAPELSPTTIRRDLERTGDVQTTVERYLNGTLVERNPQPVAVSTGVDQQITNDIGDSQQKSRFTQPQEKVTSNEISFEDENDGPFNGKTYDQIKREMILQGRLNMEKKLEREIYWQRA